LYWEQVAVPRALRHGNFDLFHAPAEHGVPLVRPCPLPEIVGEQGSLIDPRDHPRAASTILALLEHDNAAAVAAARRAAARFDWSTTCTQTLDVYRRVLGA